MERDSEIQKRKEVRRKKERERRYTTNYFTKRDF
jgi:hypothetical protein